MKTKELISLLQAEDPSGELEVVADGVPIYVVERLPAYYDGTLQALIQDKTIETYNVLGYKLADTGEKVLLRLMDITAVLYDNPNAQIDLSEASPTTRERWNKFINKIKEEMTE